MAPHAGLLFFLILLPAAIYASSADDLPSWMLETHSVKSNEEAGIRSALHKPDRIPVDPSKVIHLSWKPRAFLYPGFLTDEECDHLVQLAKHKLQKSTVVDDESGKSVLSNYRTSSGMFLSEDEDEIVSRIENKIAAWTFLPKENGEAIQILRYESGEKYDPHFDSFHDKLNEALGGLRVATVLMYLSSAKMGGETVFPNSEEKPVKDDSWSECGKAGVAVKPRKGDALLFFSLHPTAILDESSLHAGCPVIEGEKWSATKWIHVQPFRKPKATGCQDENEKCGEWAAYGECKENPAYMVGSPKWPGMCRKSCKVC